MLESRNELAGTARRRVGPLIAWLVFVGILVLVGYAARLSGTETPDNLAYKWSSSLAALIQYWLFLVVILAIALIAKLELRGCVRAMPTRLVAARPRARLALPRGHLSRVVRVRAVLSLFGDWSPTDEQGLVPDGWDSSRAAPFIAFFLVVTLVAPGGRGAHLPRARDLPSPAVGRPARDPGDRRALRSRARSRLRPPDPRLLRDRRRLAAGAHEQHLPGDRAPRDVQRHRAHRLRERVAD